MNERQELEELEELDRLEARASQGQQAAPNALSKGIDYANQAVNLGNTYMEGRTFGVIPKVESAIGAAMAYPVVAGLKTMQGESVPSYSDLYKTGVEGFQDKLKQSREDHPYLSAAAEIGGSLKTAGQFGETGLGEGISNWVKGQAAPAAASFGEKAVNLLGKSARSGLAGEAGYRAYKVGSAAPGQEGKEAVSGFPVGGVIGAAAPVLGAGYNAAKSALTPKIDPAKAPVIELAKKYNIPLGMDDLTNSKFYKTVVSEGETIPFSGSADKVEKQQLAFNRAISKSVGLDTDRLTVQAVDNAFGKVGKEFDDLTKGKTFQINDDVADAYNEILQVAEHGGYGAEGSKHLDSYLKDLGAVTDKDGVVSGERLSNLRAKLNSISRKASNQDAKQLASDLENMITNFITDDAPEAMRQAKYRYKNLIALEPIAQKNQIEGNISPAELLGRVRTVYKRAFTRGQAGELGDLANIGQHIKQTVPNSGTSQRTLARNILTGNAATAIPFGFVNPIIPVAQAVGAGAGMAGNRLLQNRNYDQELIQALMKRPGAVTKQIGRAPGVVTGDVASQMARMLMGAQQ